MFTSLTSAQSRTEQSDFGLSSLMDTWISLVDINANGERNRGLYLLKSRGMSHSNQISEYQLTGEGIKLIEPYLGAAGVLTGSARIAQQERDKAEVQQRLQNIERQRREIARKRALAERQIADLRADIESEEAELARLTTFEESGDALREETRAALAASRGVRLNGEKSGKR